MRRRFSACCITLLAAAAIAGCTSKTPPPGGKTASEAPQDSHGRMLAVLREMRDREPDNRPYLGDATLRRTEAELASLSPAAPDTERIRLNAQLGYFEMFHGDVQEAVNHLQTAYDGLQATTADIREKDREFVIFGLALAYLRLAETQNCVHCNNGASCLLPIQGEGVHRRKEGSEGAVKYLEVLLAENPERLDARWLLNIAYMTLGRYPQDVSEKYLIPPEKFASEEEFPRFENVAGRLGLDARGLAGGAIVDDFDGDGFLDIITSDWDTGGQMRYVRNNGDGTFTDRTEEAGLVGIFGGLNCNQADYDNDGDLDVVVLRGAWMGEYGRDPKSLLQNDGKGHFRDVAFDAGLADVFYPTQTAAWADYDNDGDLDLYVGNEAYPAQLFRNNGDGTFTDVAAEAGVQNENAYAKAVVWGDYDNDRDPDIYVSNLRGSDPRDPDGYNRLYRNNGDGTFTDVARELGVEKPLQSFPAWFWDYNNDGALDILAFSYDSSVDKVAADYLDLPYDGQPDCLYEGDGNGGFRDVTAERNLVRATQPMGSNFGDLDYDGYPDFYLGTGYQAFEGLMPNLMFHNRRGESFADVTTAGNFGHLQKGHGVAFADLDQDGDQDVFIKMGGAYPGDAFQSALFENPGFGNRWIVAKLIGAESNRCAIGARIRADIDDAGQKRSVYKWVTSGGSFGANPLRQEIGLGKAEKIDRLEVFWPTTGRTQEFRDVAVDQMLEIAEDAAEFRTLPYPRARFQLRDQPQAVTALDRGE